MIELIFILFRFILMKILMIYKKNYETKVRRIITAQNTYSAKLIVFPIKEGF